MISIIICSVDAKRLDDVKKNIAQSIGIPHEIIAIDNSLIKFGICKVYNQGAAKAQYPILCFVHEDVSFSTVNWGQLICKHLADEQTGVIGLAGGDSKSRVPSSWSVPVVNNEINIVQHFKNPEQEPQHIIETGSETSIQKPVIALDGVFLCVRKNVFEQFQFDETTFTGFHGYDIDFSLQVSTKYTNYVIFDMVVHHFSDGTPDKKWVESAILLSKKWANYLPVSIHELSSSEYNQHHWQSLQVFLKKLIELDYPLPTIVNSYFSYSFTEYFTFRRFVSMGKYVVLTSLKNF